MASLGVSDDIAVFIIYAYCIIIWRYEIHKHCLDSTIQK